MIPKTKPEVLHGVERPVPPDLRPHEVELDWEAYFARFCLEHGKWPVLDGGRLLFPDGWSYSADDYAGPEWPPPTDPEHLIELQVRYWRERRNIVVQERDRMQAMIDELDELRRHKSLPLQRRYATVDEDTGAMIGGVADVDFAMLSERLRWLIRDAHESAMMLKSLGAEP